MRRREGYSVFPALRFIPAKKWNLAECLWTTTPHAINVWMPVKIQFFSLKQIYKLFCNVFERLRAEHILAVSHLAFLDCYKASGTSAWNRLALPAAGKGPLCSHPGEGAPVRPSSPRWPQGCSEWPVEPRWGREEDYGRRCGFLHIFPSPYPSLPTILGFYFRKDDYGSLITLSRIKWRKSESVTHWTQALQSQKHVSHQLSAYHLVNE